jgi:SAM-dependent methyltransferase
MVSMPRSLRDLARFVQRQVGPFTDLRTLPAVLAEVPWFVRTRREYAQCSDEMMPLLDTHPAFLDRKAGAGSAKGHYFHQDLWAARRVFSSGVTEHIDVGSRVDGFVAHCACFTQVTYVDIRPLEANVPNLRSRVGSVLSLPFEDQSLRSLSCLHVVEHVGLGRYGDPLDPEGASKAMRELARVLAPGGSLYFGIPVGRERVCFNAHRVLSPKTVVRAFSSFELVSFAAVDDRGDLVDPARPEDLEASEYACGLFHFRRRP